MFSAVPLTSCARAFQVLEYWMQCPHQEEKNWTSQAEDEFVTLGFRLLLLRITSGSSSVYRRAAARTHPGTSHRTTAALNQNRSIPAVLLGSDEERTSESRRVSTEDRRTEPAGHGSSCSVHGYVCFRQRAEEPTDVSL